MKTIREIEKLNQSILNLSDLKDNEPSSNCRETKKVVHTLEVEIAKKRLTHKELKIAELIEFGYSHREICRELGISPNTINKTLNKLYDIIK